VLYKKKQEDRVSVGVVFYTRIRRVARRLEMDQRGGLIWAYPKVTLVKIGYLIRIIMILHIRYPPW